ncbi:hypothetical protein B0E55_01666 [Rhodococcus sp. 66b]|nr:hypothetical protein B0E55_01666 [Rhodococcus sp. 66b]
MPARAMGFQGVSVRSMSPLVRHVLQSRSVTQVLWHVMRSRPIQMAHIETVWSWSDKCCCDYSMYVAIVLGSKRYPQVSGWQYSGPQYSTSSIASIRNDPIE